MEACESCADAASGWIGMEMERFELERKAYVEWTKKSMVEKSTLSDEWKKRIVSLTALPKGKL
jgi:hypothetical protein